MAVESAFSEYNPYLWTNYKILAIDLGYGSVGEGPGQMEQKTYDYCKFNTDNECGYNFFGLAVDSCNAKEYTVLSDDKGSGVVTLGVKAAKQEMMSQVIDGIQAYIDSVNNIEKIPVEEKAKNAKKSLESAKEAIEEATNFKPEPEYYMTEEEIIKWMPTCSLDAFKDALDFAPQGVLDLIKKYAVEMPLNDMEKREAIKTQLKFDVNKAIEINRESKDTEDSAAPAQRRVKPAEEPVEAPAAPARRVITIPNSK